MATVPVVRTAFGNTRPYTMGVKVENEPVVSLISTPVTVSGTPGLWNITQTERPGRQPVTMASAPGLRTAVFEHTINARNPYESIEHFLHPLRAVAEKGKRMQFYNGGMLVSGTWFFIQSLEFGEVMKARDNRASRCAITWTLTEANLVSAVTLTKAGVKPGTVTRVPVGGTLIPAAGR
jgi:hypothetical protein